jgi:hypothetical protein
MANCTRTLQQEVNFASTHADLLPLAGVGGYTDEPALSLCNDALSDLISDPNDWKFNRVEMPILFTCPNKLDQLFAGACIFTLSYSNSGAISGWQSQGWGIAINGISVSGGVVTVTTLENHRIPVGAQVYMTGNVMTTGTTANYNSTFTDNGSNSQWSVFWTVTAITANTIQFAASAGQNNSDAGGAPGITNFGYATSAAFQELNNTSSPPNVQPCTVYRELPYVSRVSNPDRASVIADLGTGVLKIRYGFVPGSTVWGLKLVYQAKAPMKVALTDTWAPFPDNFACVYRQALLWRMYRYLNDSKADAEYQKLKMEIAKVQSADDAETTDVHLIPEESLMNSDFYWGWQ